MDRRDVEFLKSRMDQIVQVRCQDGETIVGTVVFVSESEHDVTLDFISSSEQSRQEWRGRALLLRFEEIASVALADRITGPFD
jgi:small nuclear ribonucleoprotein (snRNP)-like protein